jgi:excisionase family DNA binding protein
MYSPLAAGVLLCGWIPMPPHAVRVPDLADLLSADQVIDRLFSNPALRRHAATCVLPAVRVGREWRFRKTDLEAWIARHEAFEPDDPRRV